MLDKFEVVDGTWFQVPSKIWNNEKITLRAMRILLYMLSQADVWHFNKKKMMSDLKLKKSNFEKLLTELKQQKYIEAVPPSEEYKYWDYKINRANFWYEGTEPLQ